jgi:queuine tRNA-ribosyltransferase
VRAGEIFGLRLLSLHNLCFLEEFTRRMRQSIIDGTFSQFRSAFLANYDPHATTAK